MAMTEDQLITAIEQVMQAAHQQCQPYYLQLAQLWLPGIPVLRTEYCVSSTPTGPHAMVDRVSIVLMQDPLAPAPATQPAAA